MTSYTQRVKTLDARGIHICKCHYTEIAWFINSSQLFEKALHFCPRQVVASSKLSSLLWRLRQRLMNGLGVNYDERGGHRGCCSYVFMYPIMDAVWTISYWIENSLVTVHYNILLLSLLDNFLFCVQLRVQTHNLTIIRFMSIHCLYTPAYRGRSIQKKTCLIWTILLYSNA